MYTSRPVEFHVICDHGAQAYLEKRLQLLTHPVHDILVRFYLLSAEGMAGRIMREGSIGTDHSAGYPGLMKLFIHELLPEVEKSIFVDTDAFFMADPALLYDEFAHMNGTIAISMPSHPEQGAAHWHYASNICSCIMLLDLAKLRALPLMDSSLYRDAPSADRPVAAAPPTFEALYGAPGADGRYRDVALGDQGYWWAIVSNRTDLYRPLPHDWEVTSCLLDMYGTGLGNDAATEEDERPAMHNTDNVILPKLAHFNCLHDIYFEWDGWFDADNSLTQRWGSALDYHAGFKWIWLNRGSAALRIETVADPVFTDQRYAAEKAERTPYHR
ncbi:glycosyltransferase family 8 protein [Auriscalpium vulgare]|uniref:Glycosyltransferase family 8 protein n=1 Tax=Auriscalpium vulgare TaxID=40419 RepID=A0ACB8S0Q8_9AGAM|nr:glycosyltransferase family 8 protein [Auriscalpium vulgare]